MSTALDNKISYLNETKTEIKNILNTKFNSQIQDNDTFRSYVSKINNIYENWPKVSNLTGATNITLNNTKKGKININLKGNSYQKVTEGKNLLNFSNPDYVSSSITSWSFENDILSINGDGGRQTLRWIITDIYKNGAGKTMKIVCDSLDTSSYVSTTNYIVQMSVYYTDGTSTQYLQMLDINNSSIERTIPNDTSNVDYVYFQMYSNNTATSSVSSIKFIKPMLIFTTSSDTPYEPYTNGASPNPKYPQNINIVTGQNNIVICSKNLFNINKEYYSRLSTGTITISGNTLSVENINPSGNQFVWWNIPVEINKTIIISYDNLTETISNSNNGISYLFSDTPYTTFTSFSDFTRVNKTNKYTITTATKTYLVVGLRNIGSSTNTISNIQIKYDNSPTVYENYIGATYPIYLGNLELCKIGTYQDYIYKDNDKWYLHKEIGKVVLNGSENGWQVAAQSTNAYGYNTNISIYRTNDTALYYSNYFTPSTFNQRYITNTFFINNNNIIVFATTETSLANFKTWLSTHNTEVYYVLATPYLSLIEDTTLINQLNTLEQAMSYNNQTNISQENNNLPFIINATALMKNSD